MQVNNVQSPNFGMALKITPEGLKALKKLDPLSKTDYSKLTSLQKAGEELEDTKYAHLIIGDNLEATITTPFASKYRKSFSMQEPQDEFVKFETIYDGTESGNLKKGDKYVAIYKAENSEEAKEVTDAVRKLPFYEGLAKLTKFIDKNLTLKEKDAKQAAETRKIFNLMTEKLFNKYGSTEI